MTRFAAMGRTDHSMRPPTPATTIAFKSPNACNLCHADHDAAWADEWVRKWYPRDYQAEVLRRAELIDAGPQAAVETPARNAGRDLQKKDGDEVYKASLVRLLRGCEDDAQVAGPARAAARSVAAGPVQRGVGLGRPLDARGARGPAGGHRRSVAAGADSRGDVAGSRCRRNR